MPRNRQKVLLSSIFKPCGVDDQYGRKENIPELVHNQLNQFQGVFSVRHRNAAHGLHLIAANIDAPAVVLDFPTESRFIAELKKGYDVVGIGGIQPNMLKIKRMCELTREYAPQAKLVVGGFVSMMKDAPELFGADYLVKGEGIRAMRDLLGEPPEFHMRHPWILNTTVEYLGFPIGLMMSIWSGAFKFDPGFFNTHVIATGLGCVKGCEFCSTSYFFECKPQYFMRTGKEIYDTMDRKARYTGLESFMFVGDDNFFSDARRVEELWEMQKKHKKDYRIALAFGSADHLSRFDPQMLAEAGFDLIWIGIESKIKPFPKNTKADVAQMVAGLHKWGIKTILSSILFLDEHTKENIHHDIDYHLSLQPTFSQFAVMSAAEGTPLYDRLEEEGRIIHTIPVEECHAFKQIWFRHPAFTLKETEEYQRLAYDRDFFELGPSPVRYQIQMARALETLENSDSEILRARAARQRGQFSSLKAAMLSAEWLSKNKQQARVIRGYLEEAVDIFGSITAVDRAKALFFYGAARSREIRTRLLGDVIQPKTTLTRYDGDTCERWLIP